MDKQKNKIKMVRQNEWQKWEVYERRKNGKNFNAPLKYVCPIPAIPPTVHSGFAAVLYMPLKVCS